MITIDQLCFSYNGKPPFLLKDINLEIKSGDYISIIGENGCGKTTLMKILLGFLKPTAGSIRMDKNAIGYVPQRNDAALAGFPITVEEMMDSYRRLLKIKDKSIIGDSLKLVGMEGHKKFLVGNLSGGQTQKIWIARAIMGAPSLLILDEPSTGVDTDSQKEIYGFLRAMNLQQKITIIAVEHNLEAVFSNSNKIFHIQNGKGHLCTPQKYAEEYLHVKERNRYHATV